MGHEGHLLSALKLAQLRRGFCAPNPAVGAVVVKNNTVVASGCHFAPGYPHAEVEACSALPDNLSEYSLYVTLEPCCHWGRTPPCTEFIIQKGFKSVYYGYQDPNPKVAGKGEQLLKRAGVDCLQIPITEINDFYRSYSHWVQKKLPWVTSKLAISLDAKIAGASGDPVQITGSEAQKYTHEWRYKSDAILTSARTIMNDDPCLNVRLGDVEIGKSIYVIDSKLQLPLDAKLFKTAAKITVFHSHQDKHKILALNERNVDCHQIAEVIDGLDLSIILEKIGADGIHDLWVEAGGKIFSALIRKCLVQKSLIYIAPKLLGANAYPAFLDEMNILNGTEKTTWYSQGIDAVCEIDWSR